MARKWVDIQRNKASMPLLQFDAIIDSQTSDTCRPLDGVIKPADDPFWDLYYPPNHFNCRSTVRQLAGGRITPDADIVHPQRGIPPLFKTNLAKTGMIFPEGHPYYIGIPNNVLSYGNPSYKLNETRVNRKGNVYESGMAFDISKSTDQRYYQEYNMRLIVADAIAHELNSDVFICPDFSYPSKDLRYDFFFKGVEKYKQPDLYFNNRFWEIKSYDGSFHIKKITNMLRRAAIQKNTHVIIKLKNNANMDRVRQKAINFINESKYGGMLEKIMVVNAQNEVHMIK